MLFSEHLLGRLSGLRKRNVRLYGNAPQLLLFDKKALLKVRFRFLIGGQTQGLPYMPPGIITFALT